MSKHSITTVTLDELRLKRARGEKSETDWARVDAMTDEDIDRAIADDPDWAEFKDIDWSKATLVVPKPKKSISLRVDEDVIDFFKSTGKGYQTRINAVLRHYMREQKRRNK
ncbi:BrnA antitoxin family protein [Neorhizobium tomejilense]|uniref:BrnA antitoxin family protein n=1 Tax=Neorhizobium tomejilense TaxID=2093828 RepID=UPI003ED01CA8